MPAEKSGLLRMAIVVFGLLMAVAGQALAASDIEQSLLADIKKAERHLNETQRRIDNERRQMAERINTLEQSVLALREKTAVARRLADENTLSLSQLEKRLDSWRQQHLYQQNLLNRFIRQHDVAVGSDDGGTGDSDTGGAGLQMQIAVIAELADTLNDRFIPGGGIAMSCCRAAKSKKCKRSPSDRSVGICAPTKVKPEY
jgi:biopolymer transport protein ExbB